MRASIDVVFTLILLVLQFKSTLVDNLNAEIVLGTVSKFREARTWLDYT